MVSLKQKLGIVAGAFLLLTTSSLAQITIQASTITGALNNTKRTSINYGSFMTGLGSVNLGGPSSSSQNWDFSTYKPDTTGMSPYRSTNSYISPNGQFRSGDYPTATTCMKDVQSYSAAGHTYTTTSLSYFAALSDGFYDLATLTRTQIEPPVSGAPADTTYSFSYLPKEMVLPLPLTRGTSVTWIDSIFNTPTELERNTRVFSADAFGDVKYPDGITRPSLRVIKTINLDLVENGAVSGHYPSRKVIFIAADQTYLDFTVDTNYTSGSVDPAGMTFTVQTGTLGVTSLPGVVPSTFQLSQNYPNPFNPSTTIEFGLTNSGHVNLTVFNMLGEKVATLVDERLEPGMKSVRFDGSNLPSGVYTYRLNAGNDSQSRKLMLVK